MKAAKPVLLALAILALTLMVVVLGACGEDATQTMAGEEQSTTTIPLETTTTTIGETTTTQTTSATKVESTTTTAGPPSGPGPALVVASVSLDGSVYEEDWDAIPCICEDETRNVYQGTGTVETTVRVCEWRFWVRLTEKNGVGITFTSLDFHSITPTGETASQEHWGLTEVEMPPYGSYERGFVLNSEDSGPAQIMTGAPLPLELAGNVVVVTYAGTDANGNEVKVEVPVEYAPAY